MSLHRIFINDPTSEDVTGVRLVPGGTIAGMPMEVANQLMEIVSNLGKVLVDSAGMDIEEAMKKIRWATHVVENSTW